jgi:hypothetical protein
VKFDCNQTKLSNMKIYILLQSTCSILCNSPIDNRKIISPISTDSLFPAAQSTFKNKNAGFVFFLPLKRQIVCDPAKLHKIFI